MKRASLALGLLCLLAYFSVPSSAQAVVTSDSSDVLKGLYGVFVIIENIDKDAQADGLNKEDIQTDVELRLRQSGITILTEEEQKKTRGYNVLIIDVNTLKSDTGLYAYNIEVHLDESVTLERDKNILVIGATTWHQSVTGTVGERKIATLRDNVKDFVDKFCNDYLKANPKGTVLTPPKEEVSNTVFASTPEALKGLDRVSVLLDDKAICSAAKKAGFTQETIREDVETKLLQSGIPIVSQEMKDKQYAILSDTTKTPAQRAELFRNWIKTQQKEHVGWLFVEAKVSNVSASHLYVLEMRLCLRKSLLHNEFQDYDISNATVWENGSGIVIVSDANASKLREKLSDAVEGFTTAFLKVNPKK